MAISGVFVGLVIFVALLLYTFRVLREYERGVIFTLGRFWKVKGPGLIIVVPVIQQMVKVDLRTVVMDVPSQDVISRDNVSVKVNAVIYFRVIDAEKAIIQVEDFLAATSQLAQTTLRSVLGQHELDDMLAEREKLNSDIQTLLDQQTDAWGIKVANVEIKHVDIDETMVRAIARQAEAERERRAKVIHAEGEMQAAEKLVAAAKTLNEQPQSLQLRYLQTLTEIAGEKSSTIVFPLPLDSIGKMFGQDVRERFRQLIHYLIAGRHGLLDVMYGRLSVAREIPGQVWGQHTGLQASPVMSRMPAAWQYQAVVCPVSGVRPSKGPREGNSLHSNSVCSC
jgi:regulator of protease activity HflC (stomatin/prohibitin superfamily)